MTLTFDTNLDQPYLATKENKQVVTPYFKSNTSKGKDTILLYATIIFCWRYCRRCERRWPHDYNDDDENDENRSNDDDINDFDEDNDSKSEVNHKKKVNDEPQKEKRWTLLKKDRLRRRFALNSFTFLQFQVWPAKSSMKMVSCIWQADRIGIFEILLLFFGYFSTTLETHGNGLTIYFSKDLEDHAKLKRFIIAYPLKYLFV